MKKRGEQQQGTILAGVDGEVTRKKAIEGAALNVGEHYVFRLSDRAYNNLQLVDELSYFQMLFFYNRQWAILQIAIGASGREIFGKAFTAWIAAKRNSAFRSEAISRLREVTGIS